jgi:hypothetical protein
MKMGTIRSPCPYDAAAPPHAPIGKSATEWAAVSDFASSSAYTSIATLPINPVVDVMCYSPTGRPRPPVVELRSSLEKLAQTQHPGRRRNVATPARLPLYRMSGLDMA